MRGPSAGLTQVVDSTHMCVWIESCRVVLGASDSPSELDGEVVVSCVDLLPVSLRSGRRQHPHVCLDRELSCRAWSF